MTGGSERTLSQLITTPRVKNIINTLKHCKKSNKQIKNKYSMKMDCEHGS